MKIAYIKRSNFILQLLEITNLYLAYEALKYYPEYNITFQQEIYREEYWLEIMPKTAS